jgi:hypothetical protein
MIEVGPSVGQTDPRAAEEECMFSKRNVISLAVLAILAVGTFSGCVGFGGEADITEFFTDPVRDDDLVVTKFLYEVDPDDTETFANALLLGFYYTADYAESGDTLGVVINYSNGTSYGYLVDYDTFMAFANDEISAETFLGEVSEIELD